MKRAILKSEKSGITSKNRKNIYAEVLMHNKSSVKFFQSCGYKLKTINNQRIILKKISLKSDISKIDKHYKRLV